MIREIYDKILEQQDIRQNLIKLKSELKENNNKTALLYQIGADYSLFDQLLMNQDAKIRKNAALIMGELTVPCFLDKLFDAYKKEEQLFVKSSYLIAIKNFEYEMLLPDLKKRLSELTKIEIDDSNKKHIREEIRVLSELILAKEGIAQHVFTGYQVPSELILLTNRNYVNITLDQLHDMKPKEFTAGVMLKTNDLRKVLPIRTYSEVLFMLDDLKVCKMDADAASKAIAASSLLEFMTLRHLSLIHI